MSGARRVVERTYVRARDGDVRFTAAGIAYYWFVSLLPLAIVAFTVARAVYGDALAEGVLSTLGSDVPASAEQALADAVQGSDGAAGVTATGVAAFGWSAVRVVRGVGQGFDRVYDDAATEGWRAEALETAVVVPVVLAALGVAGAGVFVGLTSATATVVQFALLALVLLPLYVVVPNGVGRGAGRRLLTATVPGALLAAAVWSVLVHALRIYVAYGGYSAAYGVLGGALLVVTFLYLGALSVLAGAALNAALAGPTE